MGTGLVHACAPLGVLMLRTRTAYQGGGRSGGGRDRPSPAELYQSGSGASARKSRRLLYVGTSASLRPQSGPIALRATRRAAPPSGQTREVLDPLVDDTRSREGDEYCTRLRKIR